MEQKKAKYYNIAAIYKEKKDEDGNVLKPESLYMSRKNFEILSGLFAEHPELNGLSFGLVSKARKLKNCEDAMANGKLSAEIGAKIKEQISRMPDDIRFEVTYKERNPAV